MTRARTLAAFKRRRSPVKDAIAAVLDAEQIPWTIHVGGAHPRIVFYVCERRCSHTMSCSPSDVRAAKNAAACVRRQIREARGEHRSSTSHR